MNWFELDERVELKEVGSSNFEVNGRCTNCSACFKKAGSVMKDGTVRRFNGHAKVMDEILRHAISCGKAPGPHGNWRFKLDATVS